MKCFYEKPEIIIMSFENIEPITLSFFDIEGIEDYGSIGI
jgi:hypothetical protein